jgi:hypothetical protein
MNSDVIDGIMSDVPVEEESQVELVISDGMVTSSEFPMIKRISLSVDNERFVCER